VSDSPSEYIAKLETELRAERAVVQKFERQAEELRETIRNLRAAAASAAATTVTALERIQQLEDIYLAAVDWIGSELDRSSSHALVKLVEDETARRKARS
jgi:hypothetical protein